MMMICVVTGHWSAHSTAGILGQPKWRLGSSTSKVITGQKCRGMTPLSGVGTAAARVTVRATRGYARYSEFHRKGNDPNDLRRQEIWKAGTTGRPDRM